jgi:hypothetical protein
MMLRTFVLLLVLLNAAWFAWAQGILRPLGLGPDNASEPQRLELQLRPELLRIERGAAAATAGAPTPQRAPAAPGAPQAR